MIWLYVLMLSAKTDRAAVGMRVAEYLTYYECEQTAARINDDTDYWPMSAGCLSVRTKPRGE